MERILDIEKAQKYFDIAGVMMVVIDINQKVTLINNKGCEVLNYKREEVIGKNWFDNFISQRLRDEIKKVHKRLLGGGIDFVEYFENPILTKNDEERIIAWHNTLLRDDKGRVIATLSSGTDITERKRTEEELARYRKSLEVQVKERTADLVESEERFKGVVDNIAVGVAVISPDMEILSLNKQMKKWFPDIDIAKRPICYRAFNNPSRQEVCVYCPTIKTLKDGQTHESVTETPSGNKIINYRILSSPVKDEDGRIMAVIEVVDDVTEYKRVENAQKEAYAELELRVRVRTAELSKVNEDLREKMRDLERFTRLAVAREEKMIELKERIRELEKRLGEK